MIAFDRILSDPRLYVIHIYCDRCRLCCASNSTDSRWVTIGSRKLQISNCVPRFVASFTKLFPCRIRRRCNDFALVADLFSPDANAVAVNSLISVGDEFAVTSTPQIGDQFCFGFSNTFACPTNSKSVVSPRRNKARYVRCASTFLSCSGDGENSELIPLRFERKTYTVRTAMARIAS